MCLVRSIVFCLKFCGFLFRKCVPVFGVTRRNCLKVYRKSQLLRVILVISLPISPSKTCQAKRLTRLRCYCPSDRCARKSDVLTFDTFKMLFLILFHGRLSKRWVHVYWVLLDNLSAAQRGYLAFSFFQLWVVLGSFSPCRSALRNPTCKWIYRYVIHIQYYM